MAMSPMHHHYGKRYPSHPNALYSFLNVPPLVPIALYRKMQSFGAFLKFDLHFFVFNGIIQTILVTFSMKKSKTSTGMLSSVNDDFKYLKLQKT